MPIFDLHEVVVDGKTDGKSKFRVPVHMKFVKTVGTGAYGCVASFTDSRAGDTYAVKKITNGFDDLVDGKRILREVKILRQMEHDNIIRILDMYPPLAPDFDDIYIVTDLMETDLHRVIYSKQPLTEEHHAYFIHQILRGLVYLHSAHVVHRDLKPSNILVNKDCSVKICDFGLARVLSLSEDQDDLGRTDYVVTRWYRAPEVVLLASEYTMSIDVWAVGCILAELVERKPLFNGKDHLDQIRKIISIMGTPSDDEIHWLPPSGSARSFIKKCTPAPKVNWSVVLPGASPTTIAVIDAMLRFDPAKRASVEDALRLKYFENLFEEEDLADDTRSTPVDWSFDKFTPSKPVLQDMIYCECACFHPEIIERDRKLGLFQARPNLERLLEETVASRESSSIAPKLPEAGGSATPVPAVGAAAAVAPSSDGYSAAVAAPIADNG